MTDRTRVLFVNRGSMRVARIGTRVNAVPEMIADNASGLLVPPGDRRALVGALRTLLDSPSLRHRLGRAAREQVLRDAHPDDYRHRLVHIIHEAAHRPPVGRVA